MLPENVNVLRTELLSHGGVMVIESVFFDLRSRRGNSWGFILVNYAEGSDKEIEIFIVS